MSNPVTDAINKAIADNSAGSTKSVPDAKPVSSSTLRTTSKSGK